MLAGVGAAWAVGSRNSTTGRRRAHAAARPPRDQRPATAAVVALSAALGAVSPGAPTGGSVEDAVLRGLFVALLALAATSAPSWALALAGVAAVVAAAGSGWAALGAAGVGLLLGGVIAGRSPAALRAATGGLIGLALLHLRFPDVTRGTAGVAAAVALIILVPGWWAAGRRVRRRTFGAVMALGVVATAAAAAFAVVALTARRAVDDAVNQATTGITAGRRGDTKAAAASLRTAAAGFASAHHDLDVWWAKPARYLPVVAQQVRVVTTLSADGAKVALAGADAAQAADPELFRVKGGSIDPARLRALVPPVDRSLEAIRATSGDLARVRSPWNVSIVDHVLARLAGKLHAADDQAQTLDAVVKVLPAMLGADGPRHYFLALVTLSEARGAGGFMGNWAELTTDRGSIHLTRFGRHEALDTYPRDVNFWARTLEPTPDFFRRYGTFGIQYHFADATMSPDFPTVAKVISALYPSTAGGRPVDGVFSLDPYALAAILRLTGPVSVPGWPVPISADNAVPVLLHDAYVQLPQSIRVDFLSAVAKAVFDRLTTTSLPGPSTLIDTLGPVVKSKDMMLYANRADEQDLLARTGAAGSVRPVAGDFLGVVSQSLSASKIDWYMHRTITYDATVDPATGATRATVDVAFTNQAPVSGLPPEVIGLPPNAGTNTMYLSVYSPLQLTTATFNGATQPMQSQTEFGRPVYSAQLAVPSGATRHLVLTLQGHIPPGSVYRLDISRQPTPFPDSVAVTVHPTAGWTVVPTSDPEGPSPLSADRTVTMTFKR